MKKELPILYGAEMVRAQISGRKTQTRRIINPQPGAYAVDFFTCPYGQPGDWHYVRETWSSLNCDDGVEYAYKASATCATIEAMEDYKLKWKPSIHMPKVASRIWNEVVCIRAELLQEISEADAIAEGILKLPGTDKSTRDDYKDYSNERNGYYRSPVDSYRTLWEKINGPGSWDLNPWVWVIEFKTLSTDGKPPEGISHELIKKTNNLPF